MKEPEWTPGPWVVEEDHAGNHTVVSARDEWVVRDMSWGPEEKHDAHLIAAAPDLYEALDVMLQQWVDLAECGDAGYWDANQDASVIQARMALAKARGEAR